MTAARNLLQVFFEMATGRKLVPPGYIAVLRDFANNYGEKESTAHLDNVMDAIQADAQFKDDLKISGSGISGNNTRHISYYFEGREKWRLDGKYNPDRNSLDFQITDYSRPKREDGRPDQTIVKSFILGEKRADYIIADMKSFVEKLIKQPKNLELAADIGL